MDSKNECITLMARDNVVKLWETATFIDQIFQESHLTITKPYDHNYRILKHEQEQHQLQ